MSAQKRVPTRRIKHRFSNIAIAACGHLLASVTLFVAFSASFLTERSAELLGVGLQDAALRTDVVGPLVLNLGLASCVWAMVFIIYKLARTRISQPKHVVLKKAKGTVIAETLIVLPVFFCLTFGLAQMALSSIAGLLTTLATYEVTRGLAVWSVEEGNARRVPGGNVTRAEIVDRMRLQAASIIAPATPEFSQGAGCLVGPAAQAMLLGMTRVGLLSPVATGQGEVSSMAEAFGHRTFAERAPTKLIAAYCAVQVNWTGVNPDPEENRRSEFTATLRYQHPVAMPVIGIVFTDGQGSGPWQTPYVSTIERSYSMTAYLSPNDELPY